MKENPNDHTGFVIEIETIAFYMEESLREVESQYKILMDKKENGIIIPNGFLDYIQQSNAKIISDKDIWERSIVFYKDANSTIESLNLSNQLWSQIDDLFLLVKKIEMLIQQFTQSQRSSVNLQV
jgi:hypothetical protein